MKSARWSNSGLLVVALLLGASMAYAQGTQLAVSNVQVTQRPLTAVYDISYDLETVGDVAVTVRLFLSTDGGASYPYLCQVVSGDVGAGVLPGSDKHIVWDAGADFPGLSSTTCQLRVTADDGELETPVGFVPISPCVFMMGSPTTEPERFSNETQHEVTLTHGIYIQTTEVTNQRYTEMAQWAYDHGHVTVADEMLFDNLDGSTQLLKFLTTGSCEITFSDGVFSCVNPTHPVKEVTWYGSVAYCDWLSLRQGLARAYNHSTWQCNGGIPYAAEGFRLPTEAEWEYACRAGTQTPFNTGLCLDAAAEANYDGNYPYSECTSGPYVDWTVPAGSYPANAFGLYDMHGNEWEWCNDWYAPYGGTVTDPVGPGTGSYRVVRGGGWSNQARNCRSAIRFYVNPAHADDLGGFRPVKLAW